MPEAMRAPLLFACVMAAAISACAIDDGGDPMPAGAARAPALATTSEKLPPAAVAVAVAPPAVSAAEPGSLRAVAADVSNIGEPMILVAGWRDDESAAGVPVYAQRNGGWRRITIGEWPPGTASIVRAVDAADLDGDGTLEVSALGREDDGDSGDRALLVVFRLRDRELEKIAEASWDGDDDHLWLADSDGDGRHQAVIGSRQRRAARAFSLEGGQLVAREPKGTGAQRRGDTVGMSLPGADSPLRVALRAASGGRSMLATVEEWNAELARLRPR